MFKLPRVITAVVVTDSAASFPRSGMSLERKEELVDSTQKRYQQMSDPPKSPPPSNEEALQSGDYDLGAAAYRQALALYESCVRCARKTPHVRTSSRSTCTASARLVSSA